MTLATTWEIQVRRAKEELYAAKSAETIRNVWRDHLNIGHKLLGRLLLGYDIEKLIERHES